MDFEVHARIMERFCKYGISGTPVCMIHCSRSSALELEFGL